MKQLLEQVSILAKNKDSIGVVLLAQGNLRSLYGFRVLGDTKIHSSKRHKDA